MLECPICRRSYEGRFQVFVPPHHESFDTVTCARRAAEAWGWNEAGMAPIILPTIEAVHARPEPQVASVARRRGVALAGFELASGQAALATGVGLLAAGAAASIYLGFRPGDTAPSLPIAAGAPATRQTIGPPPAATRPAATGSHRTRPAAKKVSRAKFVASRGAGRSAGIASGSRAALVIANSPSGLGPSTSPAESAVGSPADARKPRPSTPKAPPATSVTPKPPAPSSPPPEPSPLPVNPTGVAEASTGGGSIGEAGSPSPQSPPSQSPPPQTPPPQTPPPQTPPPQTPPPTQTTPPADQAGPEDEGDDDEPSGTRPGHGWGDENHEHTGPPGQGSHGNGNGNGNGNGGGNGHGH